LDIFGLKTANLDVLFNEYRKTRKQISINIYKIIELPIVTNNILQIKQ